MYLPSWGVLKQRRKGKMLWQYHHQNKKTGKSEFVSQFEVPNNTDRDENLSIMYREFDRVKEKFPPPPGTMWMICNENSEHFIKTTLNPTYTILDGEK